MTFDSFQSRKIIKILANITQCLSTAWNSNTSIRSMLINWIIREETGLYLMNQKPTVAFHPTKLESCPEISE